MLEVSKLQKEKNMELEKIPPHDIEAEQAVIGSMLTDSDAVVEAIEVLKSDDFVFDKKTNLEDELLDIVK